MHVVQKQIYPVGRRIYPPVFYPCGKHYMKKLSLPYKDAEGKVCGVCITPYPPGIPLVTPGEIINREVIDYVDILIRENFPVHGINNRKIKVLKAHN